MNPPSIAANSEVFAIGTPVSINSSGNLIAATAGTKVWGYSTEAVTVISTNANGTAPQTTAPTAIGYAPRVISCSNVEFWADGDEAWVQTDNDQYVDIGSASAGVVTLNLPGGSTGQFAVMGSLAQLSGNPSYSGDTTKVVVRAAEWQDLAYAQS